MSITIIATGSGIPSRKVSNTELAALVDTSDEWIRSHTGIGNRYIAESSVASSDLASEAAKAACASLAERTGVSLEEVLSSIDIIVLATATPDYYNFPSTACVVQDKIGAKHAAAFDIVAGCTGFVYGLEVAAGLLTISSDKKRALVIGAEVLSRIVDWSDRGSCVLFGDGAGAVLIEKTEGNEKTGLIRSFLSADGSGGKSLMRKRGESSNRPIEGNYSENPGFIEMNGQAVYIFAVKAVTDTIEKLIREEGISVDDVRYIIPHQANARIVRAAGKRLNIPDEKFYLNMEEYANTSAASVPIVLDELNRKGAFKKGDLIMTVGFGSGLTFGGNLIIW